MGITLFHDVCATTPARHNLEHYDIMVDNSSLPGMPISCANDLCTQPYVEFLKTAKWFNNGFAGNLLTMSEYEIRNFIIAYDLQNIKNEDGWLSVRLKFESTLPEKLMLITLLISPKNVNYR